MSRSAESAAYRNPVYARSFPDPFVLKFRGEYWAFCTGFWHDGRVFGVLHSRDLVHWQELGGALAPFPEHHPCYWAPEVSYFNNQFYLYYSVGDEARMHLRVAVADAPAGPYADSGRQLTDEEFAIDAHVFVDDDGARYLFYATDFLAHTHVGTGTVCDRLLDPLTLAKQARPVTRALYDWQVYDPQRAEKGGVRWHTVEGPTVLRRKNRYYQMFSGGNWQNLSYGVSYAVAENLNHPDEWQQVADGHRVLPILRTVPDKVIGPGHNSVVRGPDNRQLFAVYHLWQPGGAERVMAVDRLEWAGERMLIAGPSTEPQPAPLGTSFADAFDRDGDAGPHWTVEGENNWTVRDGELRVEGLHHAPGEARCRFKGSSFLVETYARHASGEAASGGGFGLSLTAGGDAIWRALLLPQERQFAVSWLGVENQWMTQRVPLPQELNANAWQLWRVEVDGDHVACRLAEWPLRWQGSVRRGVDGVALCAQGAEASFAAFALTAGWEDLFTSGPELHGGWRIENGHWSVRDRQLCVDARRQAPAIIVKESSFGSYEMVAAARFAGEAETGGYFGFYPAANVADESPLLVAVEQTGDGWVLRVNQQGPALFHFPARCDAQDFQLFRFLKQRGELIVQWESEVICAVPCHPGPARTGLGAHDAHAVFDAVRVTAVDNI